MYWLLAIEECLARLGGAHVECFHPARFIVDRSSLFKPSIGASQNSVLLAVISHSCLYDITWLRLLVSKSPKTVSIPVSARASFNCIVLIELRSIFDGRANMLCPLFDELVALERREDVSREFIEFSELKESLTWDCVCLELLASS